MPFAGGVFTRLYNWVADKNANVKITASRMDGEDDGFAAAINAIVAQTQPFVGPVKAPGGTAALPGITFDGDENTGIYNKAANVIGVTANGTNAIDLTATGVKFVATGDTIDYFGMATFTPKIAGGTVVGAGTYTAQTGHYIRIANAVFFTLRLVWTAHTGTGTMHIRDLPFATITGHSIPVSIVATTVTIPAGEFIVAQIDGGTDNVLLGSIPDAGGAFSDLPIDATGNIVISGWYRVA